MKCENNPLNNLVKMPETPTTKELITWLTSNDQRQWARGAGYMMQSISRFAKETGFITPKQEKVALGFYRQTASHHNLALSSAGKHRWRINRNRNTDGIVTEICEWCGVNKKDLTTTTNPEEGIMKAPFKVGDRVKIIKQDYLGTVTWVKFEPNAVMVNRKRRGSHKWDYVEKVEKGGYTVTVSWDPTPICRLHTMQNAKALELVALESQLNNPEEGNNMDSNPIPTTNPEEGTIMYTKEMLLATQQKAQNKMQELLAQADIEMTDELMHKLEAVETIIDSIPYNLEYLEESGEKEVNPLINLWHLEPEQTNPKEGNKMEAKPIYHIAFTGHRPNKLGGYDDNSPKRLALRQQIEETLQRAVVKYGTTHQIIVISGGALGVDQDAARVAYKMNIPFVVAQPCKNHESKWPKESQIKYNKMLELAIQVVLVSDGTYTELGAKCMQDRNIWMVDNCDALIAVWDGTSGGTANCVQYAQKVGKPIVFINPNNLGGNSTNNTERTTS